MADMDNADCIELGFILETEKWKLRSKYFPSKVGGLPAWLDLESLPKEDEMICKKCRKPLIFLCQLYAPFTSKEECFHRTLFVFICREGECSEANDSSNIKVLRCQLPRKNKFYSFEPPKEEEKGSESPSAADYCKLCRICGSFGSKVCGGCKKVTYCSRDHQAKDWKSGHKLECKNKDHITPASEVSKTTLFPEYELELEPEEIDLKKDKTEEEVLKEYEDLLKTGQRPTYHKDTPEEEVDLLKLAAKETDKKFANFRTRIKNYPDQVVRYDRGGEPLLVSSENEPKDIPSCSGCGEPRKFEFQIMPQLLVHMKADSPGKSIDWGTVIVYTCSTSCSQEKAYIEEVAFKQDYTPTTDFLKQ